MAARRVRAPDRLVVGVERRAIVTGPRILRDAAEAQGQQRDRAGRGVELRGVHVLVDRVRLRQLVP